MTKIYRIQIHFPKNEKLPFHVNVIHAATLLFVFALERRNFELQDNRRNLEIYLTQDRSVSETEFIEYEDPKIELACNTSMALDTIPENADPSIQFSYLITFISSVLKNACQKFNLDLAAVEESTNEMLRYGLKWEQSTKCKKKIDNHRFEIFYLFNADKATYPNSKAEKIEVWLKITNTQSHKEKRVFLIYLPQPHFVNMVFHKIEVEEGFLKFIPTAAFEFSEHRISEKPKNLDMKELTKDI